jgi:hypothetical protein
LNVEWLQKYFRRRPRRNCIINPQEEIIDKGGLILCPYNDQIVGNGFPEGQESVYEVSKMAVTRCSRIRNWENTLEHCFAVAKRNASNLILYSNRSLQIHLYHKYGFVEIPLEGGV